MIAGWDYHLWLSKQLLFGFFSWFCSTHQVIPSTVIGWKAKTHFSSRDKLSVTLHIQWCFLSWNQWEIQSQVSPSVFVSQTWCAGQDLVFHTQESSLLQAYLITYSNLGAHTTTVKHCNSLERNCFENFLIAGTQFHLQRQHNDSSHITLCISFKTCISH